VSTLPDQDGPPAAPIFKGEKYCSYSHLPAIIFGLACGAGVRQWLYLSSHWLSLAPRTIGISLASYKTAQSVGCVYK